MNGGKWQLVDRGLVCEAVLEADRRRRMERREEKRWGGDRGREGCTFQLI